MAIANLNKDAVSFTNDMDSVILTDYFQGKRGGVSLDWTGFAKDFVRAGHVVIHNPAVVDSHKPMPLNANGTAYGALPENHVYYGFTVNTCFKGKQANGIAVRGNRNPLCVDATNGYYDIAPLLTAIKAALPTFTFLGDNQ